MMIIYNIHSHIHGSYKLLYTLLCIRIWSKYSKCLLGTHSLFQEKDNLTEMMTVL